MEKLDKFRDVEVELYHFTDFQNADLVNHLYLIAESLDETDLNYNRIISFERSLWISLDDSLDGLINANLHKYEINIIRYE